MPRPSVRQHIIETAADLFYHNGYNLTGINEVIETAGVAKATLYNHFRSKEELCVAFLEHMNAGFIRDLNAYLDGQEAGSARLLGLFDFLHNLYTADGFNGCWCINTVAELPRDDARIRTEIRNHKTAFLRLIESRVAAALPAQTPKDHIQIARQIYLLYEGAVSESHLHGEAWPIQTAQQTCARLLN